MAGLAGAMGGYAAQLTAEEEQNRTAISERALMSAEYQNDMQSIAAHADQMYRTVMTQIGYDEYLMADAESQYNEYMSPYWTALEKWYQEAIVEQGGEAIDVERELGEASLSAASAAKRSETARNILVGAGSFIGLLVGGVGGATVGGLIGLAIASLFG